MPLDYFFAYVYFFCLSAGTAGSTVRCGVLLNRKRVDWEKGSSLGLVLLVMILCGCWLDVSWRIELEYVIISWNEGGLWEIDMST